MFLALPLPLFDSALPQRIWDTHFAGQCSSRPILHGLISLLGVMVHGCVLLVDSGRTATVSNAQACDQVMLHHLVRTLGVNLPITCSHACYWHHPC